MTDKKPTPTSHGAWRVVDGQLVDESTLPTPAAKAIQEPTAPASPESKPSTSRKASTPRE